MKWKIWYKPMAPNAEYSQPQWDSESTATELHLSAHPKMTGAHIQQGYPQQPQTWKPPKCPVREEWINRGISTLHARYFPPVRMRNLGNIMAKRRSQRSERLPWACFSETHDQETLFHRARSQACVRDNTRTGVPASSWEEGSGMFATWSEHWLHRFVQFLKSCWTICF